MYRILFSFAILLVLVNSSQAKEAFSCHDTNRIDELVNQILGFGKSDQKFPETKAEMKEFCNNQYSLINTLESYKSACTYGKRKQIITLMVISLKNWNNQICRNYSKLSRKLLASTPCANEASNGYRQCINNFIGQIKAMQNATNVEKQMGKVCCSYYQTFECMRDFATPLQACSEPNIEWNGRYIHLLMDNMVQFVCGDYNEVTDKCDRLLKQTRFSHPKKLNGLKQQSKIFKSSPNIQPVELKPFFNLMLDTLIRK